MRASLLELLECPDCHHSFRGSSNGQEGDLICLGCSKRVKVSGSIPRFISSDRYAASFSFEWSRFRTTQLDSQNSDGESENRLQQSLDVPLSTLRGKRVLDAGCGAGRFAEVALREGAHLIGVDLSFAIDAAYQNLQGWKNLDLLQADLLNLPLKGGVFDFIYSLGVLHHTPDPKAGFLNLVRLLKPGGKISITLYAGYNKVYVRSTNFWRQITTRLPRRLVYWLAHFAVPLYYLYRLPVIGLLGQAVFPISMHPQKSWRVLDTLDCYTPAFQSTHTHYEVFTWFQEAGLSDIQVLEPGVSFMGTKP